MFIAALFTVAKIWKQPKCPPIDEWVKKMRYIYTQWNITQPWKKELKLAICNNMDGPRENYAKWNKSEKDKYCMILL